MSVALQIRDVPDEVRDTLARSAADKGQSMQGYLLELVEEHANLVRNPEMFDRTAHLRIELPKDVDLAAMVSEGRDAGFQPDWNASP